METPITIGKNDYGFRRQGSLMQLLTKKNFCTFRRSASPIMPTEAATGSATSNGQFLTVSNGQTAVNGEEKISPSAISVTQVSSMCVIFNRPPDTNQYSNLKQDLQKASSLYKNFVT